MAAVADKRVMRILRRSTSLALLLLLALTAVAGATPPTFKGASADGNYLFFESEEQLVPGDTDSKRDVFVRAFDATVGDEGAYVTREVSVGPTGGNDSYPAIFERASADGQKVFFSTDEPLVAADKDKRSDVYVREIGGNTRLVSGGVGSCLPACGNGIFDVGFAGASADGEEALIVTAERLDPGADKDEALDVYEYDLSTSITTLVSAGETACAPTCGNGDFNATLRGVAADGGRAFFATAEQLSQNDDDSAIDIYARNLPNGPTILVSAGAPGCAPCGNNGSAAIFAGSSDDGSRVFLATSETLTSDDADSANDVYLRHEGATTLVTGGTGSEPASFADASSDGTRVFFTTAESLVLADENEATDVYLWTGGLPQLLTSGSCCGSNFGGATPDGSAIVFSTVEQLAPEDDDSVADVYEQAVAGGPPRLASLGPAGGDGPSPARFNGVSADGERVFFTTDEALVSSDFDDDDDIYSRDLAAAVTKLWTPPPGLCPAASCDAILVDISSDGTHAVFQTEEWLVAEDSDSEPDVYERAYDDEAETEVTRLVSTGNSEDLVLGPAPPVLTGTSPGSPGASTEPQVLGEAESGSLIKLYPTSNCSGETSGFGTVEELEGGGLRVKVPTGETMTFWATAESEGFTSLCSNPVTYTQQDPDAESPSGGTGGDGGSGASTSDPPPEGRKPPKTHDGVAYVMPLTKITYGPAFKTLKRRPVFRFSDTTGQPGTKFRCRIDRRRWVGCASPLRLKRLPLGRHVFRVKGVNAVGAWDDRPAGRSFKVVAG
jgi:Tol biopolymer transport system component